MNIESIVIALFVSFLWGVSPIIHKKLLGKYTMMILLLGTALVNLLCVTSYSLYNHKLILSDLSKMNTQDALIIAGSAMTTVFLANVLYYNVLNKHDSYVITALIYSSPFFTLFLAYFYLKEKVNYYGGIGVVFIIIGTFLIAINDYKIEDALRD